MADSLGAGDLGGTLATDVVVCCDNLSLLRGLPSGVCDLIYVDPPFGTGKRRKGSAKKSDAPVFDDRADGGLESYVAFLRPVIQQMHRVLSEQGSLYVHLDWRAGHYVKVLLDDIFGIDNFLNEIIWSYRTGGSSRRWFARKHDTLLLYAKRAGQHTFNVLRGGEFRTQGMNLDQQGRPYKNTRAGRLYFHPEGPALSDVWELPFLSTVSRERNGYPAQKPEALLERIIQASSNEGDLVADFFCGSGTALAVAKRLKRRYLGCDNNSAAVKIAARRLA